MRPPALRDLALAGAVVTALAAATPARAAGPRLVIDRAEAEPSWFPGLARLRLLVTAVVLEGGAIPLGSGEDVTLEIGGGRRRERPLVGHFAGTDEDLAVAVVVEVTWAYREELATVKEALGTLLAGLPAGARVTWISYGEEVDGGRRFESAAQVARRLGDLEADAAPGDPALLAAVDRALLALGRLAPARPGAPLRRVLVIASDGVDGDADPARYRASGARAASHGIRIHSLAYSPIDDRRPLLGLGELSKRAGGTFRWVRSREGFAPQIDTLLDELGRQYVLTFFVPGAELAGKRVGLRFKEIVAEPVRIEAVACGGRSCAADEFCAARICLGRGRSAPVGRRLLLPAAAGLALVVVAVALLRRRRRGRPMPAPGSAPIAGPAGAPPGNRLVPVLPGGGGRGAPGVAPAGAAPVAARPATLLVRSGALAGRSYPLRHGFTLGTAITCDLVLTGDRFASAQHAQIILDVAGNYTLVDRGSSNGTFVNGVRVRDVRLTHGVGIKAGATELRFLLG